MYGRCRPSSCVVGDLRTLGQDKRFPAWHGVSKDDQRAVYVLAPYHPNRKVGTAGILPIGDAAGIDVSQLLCGDGLHLDAWMREERGRQACDRRIEDASLAFDVSQFARNTSENGPP